LGKKENKTFGEPRLTISEQLTTLLFGGQEKAELGIIEYFN
jgi:hypothetical protein